MIACVISTVWTRDGANAGGIGVSQDFQDLKQFSPTLGKSSELEDSLRAETFPRDQGQSWLKLGSSELCCSVFSMMAVESGFSCELKTVVQGRQDGLKVGVPDSTLFQVQFLEGGYNFLQKSYVWEAQN